MCEPISISMGIAAAAALAQNITTSASAKKAQKSEDRSFIAESIAQNLRGEQQNQEAQDKKSARAKESMIERSRIKTIQGETGLAGNSFNKALEEAEFNEGFDIASIESNRAATQKQGGAEAEGLAAQSANRRNKIKKPDWMGGAISVATAGAGAYAAGKSTA